MTVSGITSLERVVFFPYVSEDLLAENFISYPLALVFLGTYLLEVLAVFEYAPLAIVLLCFTRYPNCPVILGNEESSVHATLIGLEVHLK